MGTPFSRNVQTLDDDDEVKTRNKDDEVKTLDEDETHDDDDDDDDDNAVKLIKIVHKRSRGGYMSRYEEGPPPEPMLMPYRIVDGQMVVRRNECENVPYLLFSYLFLHSSIKVVDDPIVQCAPTLQDTCSALLYERIVTAKHGSIRCPPLSTVAAIRDDIWSLPLPPKLKLQILEPLLKKCVPQQERDAVRRLNECARGHEARKASRLYYKNFFCHVCAANLFKRIVL
ncbi:hypothetical protein pesp021 [Peridroma alphabaculovirus]|uniref:Uncharacterized protein n=1 Tax=Peridroma alphabaculovirus TaxID=1346829 RepID=A0A068LKE6_9ABAC|nr:hypothetical protein pesp021 [Peridroma alphabaculovirus]AIE47752.1 hypothetical protein pesp021 [Peridroma alphabaculovirus]